MRQWKINRQSEGLPTKLFVFLLLLMEELLSLLSQFFCSRQLFGKSLIL
jgi:hypothetical protein